MKRQEPITDKRLSDRGYRMLLAIEYLQAIPMPVSVRVLRLLIGVGVGTAHRAIRELVDLGYLRVRRSGRGKRAVYEVRR